MKKNSEQKGKLHNLKHKTFLPNFKKIYLVVCRFVSSFRDNPHSAAAAIILRNF